MRYERIFICCGIVVQSALPGMGTYPPPSSDDGKKMIIKTAGVVEKGFILVFIPLYTLNLDVYYKNAKILINTRVWYRQLALINFMASPRSGISLMSLLDPIRLHPTNKDIHEQEITIRLLPSVLPLILLLCVMCCTLPYIFAKYNNFDS